MGKAICHEFARHGADVVVASRKADSCEQVADVIAAEYGVRSIGIGCHVGNWADGTVTLVSAGDLERSVG